jgi:hypothetical protein
MEREHGRNRQVRELRESHEAQVIKPFSQLKRLWGLMPVLHRPVQYAIEQVSQSDPTRRTRYGVPIATEKKTTTLVSGPRFTTFRLLETRLREGESRKRMRDRLSKTETRWNRLVSPEAGGVSQLPSFARVPLREDGCFSLRCYRNPSMRSAGSTWPRITPRRSKLSRPESSVPR